MISQPSFDSRNDKDYVQTFGAGTSIERRKIGYIDYGLEDRLKTEDELRMNLIALAVDRNDSKMLDALRARENPQLYFKVHYAPGCSVDFDSFYNERVVEHIASSSEEILDYFTDSFEIRDRVRYKDGSNRVYTFLFPYISQLLDLLIAAKSPFAETALKKAIKHNKKTYKRLRELILSVKNDEYFYEHYSEEYAKNLWLGVCKKDLHFYDNGSIVIFSAIFSHTGLDGMITNVAHATKVPSSPILKRLVEELNESYWKIKNLKENLGDIE